MVLNRILAHRIVPLEGQRLPEGFRHAGQGRLDIEAYLAQSNPIAALDGLPQMIRRRRGAGACTGIPRASWQQDTAQRPPADAAPARCLGNWRSLR